MKHGPEMTAGGALLARLHRLGVDVVFANSGTDFPPIIEGLAEAQAHEVEIPQTLLIPHEHIAMGMAHGYYFATGRSQAVLLHTNVGLANGAIGAINAATDHVPVLVMSGRTPTLERGRFGVRTVPIGWGQEMRDQTALVREASKWDYELRFAEQTGELLDRAHAIANSTPKGPVYLSLPREVLCEQVAPEMVEAEPTMRPAVIHAESSAVEVAARALAMAERPVIFAQRGAGTVAGFEALDRIADRWSVPVCQYWAVANAIRFDHPTYVGHNPEPWLGNADVVLVIDSLAPWMPDAHAPAKDSMVIQLGPNPLYSRFPVRNFRVDHAITSEVGPALVALEHALRALDDADDSLAAVRAARREHVQDYVAHHRNQLDEAATAGATEPMSKAWVARCLAHAIRGRSATVLSELGAPMEHVEPDGHMSWHQEPHSGGLGWGLPCAMGIKLADPGRLVVATMGDGSYLFANPVACHQAAEAHGIAVLTVVLNNAGYGAVRDSVVGMYPTGYAAKADELPLTALHPSPDFAQIAQACRVYAERVEIAAELPAAIERALEAVTQGRQALLDVQVGP